MNKYFFKFFTTFILLILISNSISAQITLGDDLGIDYSNPKEYEIGGITISGVQYLDNNVLITLTGLTVGDKIKVPGDKITRAIDNLWKQGLFEFIKITASKIQGSLIFLNIDLKERPRLSAFAFDGIRKGEANSLRDEIKLTRGDVVTENMLIKSKSKIVKYFVDKGFLNTEVKITQKKDSSVSNSMIVFFNIEKNSKVKISSLNFKGNNSIISRKLRKSMKETKQMALWRVWKASKFIEDDYKKDKIALIEKYNELGYRDAKIVKDTVFKIGKKRINVDLTIDEGKKYFFRNITWIGNTKYPTEELSAILRVKKGDIYNQKVLDANLSMNADAKDVTSLYMDDGYLFFSITPVEVLVDKDSIDLEIRIYEGKQATINKVTVMGNTKTNDNVVLREIRTKPGQLFSRSDIIRTQRELAQLRYFNQEKMAVNPKPNPVDGTVDIEYVVEETSSDQLELSGGWGGGRIVGTLGVSFNNFSAANIFKKGAWQPLPSGGGQKLSLRAQSNGTYYQSYNASFIEPWLGGKKPNGLSVSAYYSSQSNGVSSGDPARQSINIIGASIGLSKRLKWPDDYFTLYNEISYQNYTLNNYYSTFTFSDGKSNNLSYLISLGRNSIDAPIYPTAGSEITLSLQATPPFSSFNNVDYTNANNQEKYRWIEYHKWKLNLSWFTKLAGNGERKLVLNTKAKFGFLGLYNDKIGTSPFERFYLGGDGLSGFSMDGREIIAMRGYENSTLTPVNSSNSYIGGTIFDKFTVELRYPISTNPMATIFLLGFGEAGNAWSKFKNFNTFDLKRSAGVGVRIYLPMFGMLGLDWGYGFDAIEGNPGANKGHFHFSINQSID
ncbi:MAG: outer membrane protein assembly factor BamA [Bacteroidetes bacterium]|nr:outer membrane protein assembly factor BamA [Bacteroidota bacterium]